MWVLLFQTFWAVLSGIISIFTFLWLGKKTDFSNHIKVILFCGILVVSAVSGIFLYPSSLLNKRSHLVVHFPGYHHKSKNGDTPGLLHMSTCNYKELDTLQRQNSDIIDVFVINASIYSMILNRLDTNSEDSQVRLLQEYDCFTSKIFGKSTYTPLAIIGNSCSHISRTFVNEKVLKKILETDPTLYITDPLSTSSAVVPGATLKWSEDKKLKCTENHQNIFEIIEGSKSCVVGFSNNVELSKYLAGEYWNETELSNDKLENLLKSRKLKIFEFPEIPHSLYCVKNQFLKGPEYILDKLKLKNASPVGREEKLRYYDRDSQNSLYSKYVQPVLVGDKPKFKCTREKALVAEQ